jgi:hypothetical protein
MKKGDEDKDNHWYYTPSHTCVLWHRALCRHTLYHDVVGHDVVYHRALCHPASPHPACLAVVWGRIEYVWVQDATGTVVAIAKFAPTDPQAAITFTPKAGQAYTPYEFCNLHGTWKGDAF